MKIPLLALSLLFTVALALPPSLRAASTTFPTGPSPFGIAFDGAANNHVMAAPAVIGALAVAGEGAAEIAGGKHGDLLGKVELFHRALKGEHQRRAAVGSKIEIVADQRVSRRERGECELIQLKRAGNVVRHRCVGRRAE